LKLFNDYVIHHKNY